MADPKQPTKDQFVEQHFHLLFGMMVDCLTWSVRDHGDMSRKISMMREKLFTELRFMYDVLIPPNRPALNTPAAPPVSKAGPVPASPLGGR